MELTTPGYFTSRRYGIFLLVVAVFCITDLCIHYWRPAHVVSSTTLVQKILPASGTQYRYYSIQGSDLKKAPVANVTQRLAGRLAHFKKTCQASIGSVNQVCTCVCDLWYDTSIIPSLLNFKSFVIIS